MGIFYVKRKVSWESFKNAKALGGGGGGGENNVKSDMPDYLCRD